MHTLVLPLVCTNTKLLSLVLGLVYSERFKYKFIKVENMLGNIIIFVMTMNNQNINKDTDGL